MTRLHMLAPTILFSIVISCNANLVLTPRALPCLKYGCPAMDNGFYPLSPDFSGPRTDADILYLSCFYPFLSNCQYSLANGILVVDNDNDYCPGTAGKSCTSCVYSCPTSDTANYAIGVGSGPQSSILFCTYPTPSQPEIAVYYCNYDLGTGAMLFDNDNRLCSPMAIPSTFCPSHSGVIAPTTVSLTPTVSSTFTTPTSSTASSTPVTSTDSKRLPRAITGGVIGALAVLVLASYLLYRKHQRHSEQAIFGKKQKRKVNKPVSGGMTTSLSLYNPPLGTHRGDGHMAERATLIMEGLPYGESQVLAPDFDPDSLKVERDDPDVGDPPSSRFNVPGPSNSPARNLSASPGEEDSRNAMPLNATTTVINPPITTSNPPLLDRDLPSLPSTDVPRNEIDLRPQLEALREEMALLRAQQAAVLGALSPPRYSD